MAQAVIVAFALFARVQVAVAAAARIDVDHA
jgi:hypothetical protein